MTEEGDVPPRNISLVPLTVDETGQGEAAVSHLILPVTRQKQIVVLISSFLTIFVTIGLNQSYGVFQSFYVSSKDGILPSSQSANNAILAFVGTLGAGLTWAGGIFVNPWMARVNNLKWITVPGVLLMSLGFGLASISTQVWHLLLSQGLLYGVGSSMLYFPILSVAPEYFDAHRGTAMGFILSGAGVGGLVFSPLIRYLLSRVSIRWTLRIMSLLTLAIALPIACSVSRSRFAARRPTHIDLKLISKPTFWFATVAAFLQSGGNPVPLTFLSEFSIALGYSAGFGAVLLAVNNGINSASRIITGVAGDRLGRQNTLIFTVFMSAIAVCTFWLGSAFSGSRPLWLAFVIMYGAASGGYNALFPTTVAEVFGMQAYASVNGFIYFVRGLGTFFGSPVGGVILSGKTRLDYPRVVLYDAALLFGATLCVVGVRYFDAREKKSWRWRA
ncbi:hypothetical protein BP5796_09965 [Coleophoma crateriformis]|uniref:Major facilitator superfamily (MFS) profile domain-containing protein n=1 Tax=Coleophoma crateriformis TaxID=565419 RepID=A0A3D8QTW3_9HELO|nr:hypothetical protein BP5796_09965 [Coleophoma crateriformis]